MARPSKYNPKYHDPWIKGLAQKGYTVEEIANEKTDIKVVAIDVDKEGDLAGEYGVYSIPCLVVFKGGKEVKRTVGYQPKERLLDLFEGI